MKTIWLCIQAGIAGSGGVIGFLIGEIDGLIAVLVIFTVFDYLTGVIRAIIEKKLSSTMGFKGLAKKIMLFVLVAVSSQLDTYLLGGNDMLRTAVIFFYIANESISILENAASIGVPIPDKLKEILKQIHSKK